MIILYGSQSGNSLHVSNLIEYVLRYGYNSKTIYNIPDKPALPISALEMDAFNFEKILDLKTIIFVCSTHGNGTEPFNMSKFWKFLRNKNLPKNLLSHLDFAVFGLGDSSYEEYNYCSKKLYNCLVSLGAKPMIRRGSGDSQDKEGYLTDFKKWIVELVDTINSKETTNSQNINTLADILEDAEKYRNTKMHSYKATLISRKHLTPLNYEYQTIELVFNIPDLNDYNVGDCISIYPTNYNSTEFIKYNNLNPEHYHDIHSVYDYNRMPYQIFFLYLYNYTSEDYIPENKKKLLEIFTDYDLYYEYIILTRRTIFETIQDFKIKLDIEFIRLYIPHISPRHFTLVKLGNEYSITVSLVKYKTSLKEERKGLCSEYFKSLKIFTDLKIFIVKNKLNLSSKNILFICTGAGISVPRAYINNINSKPGIIEVYYGFRYRNMDCLYQDEFNEYGCSMTLVASREDQKYVQDVFKEKFKDDIDKLTIVISGRSRLTKVFSELFLKMYGKKINFLSETW